MTALKKNDCKHQLRYQCKLIAEGITEGKSANHWFDDGNDIYDIEWITYQDGRYKGARLLVAGGGPNIWVNMHTHEVEGYWWGDHCKCPFVDNIGLDEYLEELHASSK